MCFALNALSYLAVLIALAKVRIVHPRARRAESHPLADLAEGWRYAMGIVPVRRMLFTLSAVSFSIAPYTTLMPAMVVKTYHAGAPLVGLFIGAVGLGAVISAVSLARRPSVRGLAKWIGIAAATAGLGAIGFGLSRNIWISVPLMMMTRVRHVHDRSHVQHDPADDGARGEAQPRCMSYYTMFFIGVAPLGHYSAGWLAEHIGAPLTFVVGGAIAFGTGLVFLMQLADLSFPPAAGLREPRYHPGHRRHSIGQAMTTLAGRTLFITGASRGIGREIALRAARDGATIAIAAKTAEPHAKLAGTIHRSPTRCAGRGRPRAGDPARRARRGGDRRGGRSGPPRHSAASTSW